MYREPCVCMQFDIRVKRDFTYQETRRRNAFRNKEFSFLLIDKIDRFHMFTTAYTTEIQRQNILKNATNFDAPCD